MVTPTSESMGYTFSVLSGESATGKSAVPTALPLEPKEATNIGASTGAGAHTGAGAFTYTSRDVILYALGGGLYALGGGCGPDLTGEITLFISSWSLPLTD